MKKLSFGYLFLMHKLSFGYLFLIHVPSDGLPHCGSGAEVRADRRTEFTFFRAFGLRPRNWGRGTPADTAEPHSPCFKDGFQRRRSVLLSAINGLFAFPFKIIVDSRIYNPKWREIQLMEHFIIGLIGPAQTGIPRCSFAIHVLSYQDFPGT